MSNWDSHLDTENTCTPPRPPEGAHERRDNSPFEAKLYRLDASQQILKAKVDDHGRVLSELTKATIANTESNRETNVEFGKLRGSINDMVKTIKIVAYTVIGFFLVNYFGWEAVLKSVTGVGK